MFNELARKVTGQSDIIGMVMTSPTSSNLASLLGSWSEHGTGSLTSRLSLALRSAILSGMVPPDSKLPPERRLASDLSVSRHTLSNALSRLRDDGLLESVQGSGTYVRGPRLPPAAAGPRMVERLLTPARGINLSVSAPPDPSDMPEINLDLNDLLNVSPSHGYEPLGLAVLREQVAARYSSQGLETTPDQIQITNGAFHAIDLALSTLLGQNPRIGVESPSFPGVFDLIDRHAATPVEILSDAQGPRPESLARACERGIDAVYFQPAVHNPTGRLTSNTRLRRLAAILDEFETPAIEDDTLAEVTYGQRSTARLARTTRTSSVITIGSVSKLLWAGLRLGWMRTPAKLSPIAARVRIGSDLGTSVPSQLITAGVWEQLDDLAERAASRLSSRLSLADEWLTLKHPDWLWRSPQGGPSLWIELPVEDSQPFVTAAAGNGVLMAPGSAAMVGQGPSPHVRLCFDQPGHVLRAAFEILDQTSFHATTEVLSGEL
jgi:DNA-binding transcriptional MocR family regulator